MGGVVDEVVETHLAKADGTRRFGDEVFAEAEAPGLGEVLIGGRGHGGATFAGGVIEEVESRLARLEDERPLRVFRSGEVHAFVLEDVVAEHGQGGAVHGEFAEGHGFVVALVVVPAFGNALEGAAGVRHFGVEVLEEKVGGGHKGIL